MTESRYDVDAADLEETDLEPEGEPDPGEDMPDPVLTHVEADADEADVVEQSVGLGEDSEDYPHQ